MTEENDPHLNAQTPNCAIPRSPGLIVLPRMMKMNQTRVGDDSQREPEQRFYHPPEFRVHTAEDNANRLAFTEQKG